MANNSPASFYTDSDSDNSDSGYIHVTPSHDNEGKHANAYPSTAPTQITNDEADEGAAEDDGGQVTIKSLHDEWAKTVKQQKPNGGKGIAAAAVVVVLILLLTFFLLSLRALPTPAKSSVSSDSVIMALASHNSTSIGSLSGLMFSAVNSTPQMSVVYFGNITVNASNPSGVAFAYSIPVEYTYQKYGNSTKITIKYITGRNNASSTQVYVYNATAAYACTSESANASNGSASGYYCEKNATYAPQAPILGFIREFANFSNYSVIGTAPASYNNQECYMFGSSGSMPSSKLSASSPYAAVLQQPGTPINYSVNACASYQYGIPLNISLAMSSGVSPYLKTLSVVLSAKSIQAHSNSTVSALPEPLVGQSTLFVSPAAVQQIVKPYAYSGRFKGRRITFNGTVDNVVVSFNNSAIAGNITNFRTNNPKFSCLNGTALNVWIAPNGYLGHYVVHNSHQGQQCAYITMLFNE
ncbi:hypothetical protein M1373_00320 [Candidatus Marsarchaeota archaeon]|nr:hypothetical protein [Candidatus Marsarchaeota archaeon]MCL5404490.1 hypothetical protein [Candidatus Marsarchaeota archaeon]